MALTECKVPFVTNPRHALGPAHAAHLTGVTLPAPHVSWSLTLFIS